MRAPSGDQAGPRSRNASSVSRRYWVPSTRATNRSSWHAGLGKGDPLAVGRQFVIANRTCALDDGLGRPHHCSRTGSNGTRSDRRAIVEAGEREPRAVTRERERTAPSGRRRDRLGLTEHPSGTLVDRARATGSSSRRACWRNRGTGRRATRSGSSRARCPGSPARLRRRRPSHRRRRSRYRAGRSGRAPPSMRFAHPLATTRAAWPSRRSPARAPALTSPSRSTARAWWQGSWSGWLKPPRADDDLRTVRGPARREAEVGQARHRFPEAVIRKMPPPSRPDRNAIRSPSGENAGCDVARSDCRQSAARRSCCRSAACTGRYRCPRIFA